MIGIHVNNFGLSYKDRHKNYRININDFEYCISYHEQYEKQCFLDQDNYIVFVDGWIFNAPSYQNQADYVLELYKKHSKDLPYYLNGQFNVLIVTKSSSKMFFSNDIFSFRKHFYFNENNKVIISSDFNFIANSLDTLTLNDIHIIKNLQLPRYVLDDETFFSEVKKDMIKFVVWYDNEWGYCERVHDLAAVVL